MIPLVLLVVRTPAAAAVRSITAAESTVLAKVILVATAALVTQSTKTTVLVALAALQLVEVTGIATETLLLGKATLVGLALRVVCRRSGTTLLSSEGRRAGPAALTVAKRLQRILTGALLADLLLAVGVLTSVTTLRLAV